MGKVDHAKMAFLHSTGYLSVLVTLCFWLETSTSRKPVNCECLQAMQDKAFSLANPIVTQWHKENELPLCTGNGTAKDDCIFQYASNDEVLGKFENISRILHDLQTQSACKGVPKLRKRRRIGKHSIHAFGRCWCLFISKAHCGTT